MKRLRRRKEVHWFSGEMEQVLRDNDYKGGWDHESNNFLFTQLVGEVFELHKARLENLSSTDCVNVIKECCDVANFAMMIADNAREDASGKTTRT